MHYILEVTINNNIYLKYYTIYHTLFSSKTVVSLILWLLKMSDLAPVAQVVGPWLANTEYRWETV